MNKKMIKRVAMTAMALAFVLPSVTAMSTQIANAAEKTYVLRDYSQYSESGNLMVGGYFAPDLTNAAEVELLMDSGLDFICLNGQNTAINWAGLGQIFDNFDQNGMKILLDSNKGANPDAVGYWSDVLNTYVSGWNRDCVIGTDMWDEPTPDNTTEIDKIAMWIEAFEGAFPGKMFFANLLPAYYWSADTFQQAHVDYLEYYADTVLDKLSGPKMLSIDSYPLSREYNSTKTYLRQTFLSDLATTAIIAKNHGADVSFYAQTMNPAQQSTYKPSYRNVEGQADIDMQYSTFMAFGAKQIINFCYETPETDNAFLSEAMVTKDGTPTANYTYVKNAIANIDAMDEAYMQFDWNGVIISKGTTYDRYSTRNNNNKDCYGQLNNNLFANEIAYASSYNATQKANLTNNNLTSVTSTETTLVGCFMDDLDYNGYYLANANDTTRSTASSVTMNFDENTEKVRVYRGNGYTDVLLSGNSLTLSMDSGEGVFVVPYKTETGCSLTLSVNGETESVPLTTGDSFVLPERTVDGEMFLGWVVDGKAYPAGYSLTVNSNITATALLLDMDMLVGASVRINNDTENAIRWTATMDKDSLAALEATVGADKLSYGVSVVTSGKPGSLTIPIPRDRFGEKRLENGKLVWTLSGVMTGVPNSELMTSFEGRAFVKISYANGTQQKIYATGNDNLRSISYVAYCAYNDTKTVYSDTQMERLRVLSLPYAYRKDNEGSLNDWLNKGKN